MSATYFQVGEREKGGKMLTPVNLGEEYISVHYTAIITFPKE